MERRGRRPNQQKFASRLFCAECTSRGMMWLLGGTSFQNILFLHRPTSERPHELVSLVTSCHLSVASAMAACQKAPFLPLSVRLSLRQHATRPPSRPHGLDRSPRMQQQPPPLSRYTSPISTSGSCWASSATIIRVAVWGLRHLSTLSVWQIVRTKMVSHGSTRQRSAAAAWAVSPLLACCSAANGELIARMDVRFRTHSNFQQIDDHRCPCVPIWRSLALFCPAPGPVPLGRTVEEQTHLLGQDSCSDDRRE